MYIFFFCVSIKLDLQTQASGWMWPDSCSLLTPGEKILAKEILKMAGDLLLPSFYL